MSGVNRYVEQLERFAQLDDSWFIGAVDCARRGDEQAREAIVRSSLRFVPPIAQQFQKGSVLALSELIEEGNVAVEQALDSFAGQDVAAFRVHLEDRIRAHLQHVVQDLTGS